MSRHSFTLSALIVLGLLAAACGASSINADSAAQAATQSVEVAAAESGVGEDANSTADNGTQASSALDGDLSYPIVDTNQGACYDDAVAVSCPEEGEAYYGQDAQYSGNQPRYQDNGDGTVTDLVTGLMWIQDAGEKVAYYAGIAQSEDFEFAGYDDWRVPNIKELYSLMDFSGEDISGPEAAGGDPFIDDNYFAFEYGDTSAGERAIDSQWITSTIYVDSVMNNQECFFGVNFADGRIKCYPTQSIGNGYFLRLVRGDAYGENDFVDNGDGTISDLATGLIWQAADSGTGLDWPSALNYCEALETGGHADWRLPNAKELQSIVEYGRSPESTNSAALDPIFGATQISNEAGQADYAAYWSSTTHANLFGGSNAVYVNFGRSMGNMGSGWIDVHGAGAQRSDPKSGDASDYPQSHGPQGDAQRVYNYVRCVRGGVEETVQTGGEVTQSTSPDQATLDAGPDQAGLGAPPQEAIEACEGLSSGDACTSGPVTGTCSTVQGQFACVPAGGLPAVPGQNLGPDN